MAFIKRGVEVHAVANLHAKCYVFGRTAIVGSANVSELSENRLVEAGFEVSDPAAVTSCREFVRGLAGDVVELEFARQQIRYYKPPQIPFAVPRGRIDRRPRQTDLMAVALEEIDYDEADESAAERARSAASKEVQDTARFRLDEFRWSGRGSKALRKNTRVLMCTTDTRGRIRVTAPARILKIRRYRGARGTGRVMVVVEVRKYIREKPMAAVLRALGSVGRPIRGLIGAKPLHNPLLVYKLGQLWPRVS